MEQKERTKLLVIDENILAYLEPNMKDAGVLHASILRGAYHGGHTIWLEGRKVRLASEKDFDDFRVCFGGFSNKEEYEYAE